MKLFFAFLIGIILTFIVGGIYLQLYGIPGDFFPITFSKRVPNQPTAMVDTCPDKRIFGQGFSFCLPESHTIEKEEKKGFSQKFTLISTVTWDTITIDARLRDILYTDSDSKLGEVTVSYNPTNKVWESRGNCDTNKNCNPSFYNVFGVQIFQGRTRWLTYIVPMDHAGIIVFNSTGGGFIKPLEALIQTLRPEEILK